MATSITLGYWDTRGLGEHIRFLLEYAGQKFEDRRYAFDTSDLSNLEKIRGKWPSDKTSLPEIVGGKGEAAMDFPNLPYYVETRPDGTKLKLTQSLAITRHLARKFDLVVKGEDQQALMELYEQQLTDLRNNCVGHAYQSSLVAWRFPNYPEDCKALFKTWERILSGKQWLMGSKLTYIDFIFYELLEWHRILVKDLFKEFPELGKYSQRFEQLPAIKNYMSSGRFHAWPFTSPYAKNFGFFK